MGKKDNMAVITWRDTAVLEKTKIAKDDDQYKKSDYRKYERVEDKPTSSPPTLAVRVE
jgi:hypothetical protein